MTYYDTVHTWKIAEYLNVYLWEIVLWWNIILHLKWFLDLQTLREKFRLWRDIQYESIDVNSKNITLFKGYITRVKVLQQHCPVELSAVIEILYIGSNTVMLAICGWLLSTWNASRTTEKLNFKFYLILTSINLSLIATFSCWVHGLCLPCVTEELNF